MRIDQKTAVYGIVGYPLGHTQSPAMHNAAFLRTHMNAVYLAFETRDMDGCLQGMRGLGIKGLSITIPHKSTVIPLLDQVDDLALNIGAVNTIVNQEGSLVGYNTDATGALRALTEKIDPAGKHCLLIGAGGAARAIGFALTQQEVRLSITNRSVARGELLARALKCPFIPLERVKAVHPEILIHATSVGMYPREEECVVTPAIFQKEMVVMDAIYNPLNTRFLRLAAKQGCTTISGLGMFIYQGAEQFRLWTGLTAPVITMKKAVEQVLGSLP